MREYLIEFFNLSKYSEEAITSLLTDYDKLMNCSAAKSVFDKYVAEYEGGNLNCIRDANADADKISAEAGVSTYASQFLLLCCLTRGQREYFRKAGLGDELWLETMLDLKYKMLECKTYKGVYGTFVSFWYPEFYTLNRFTFGRLQYQDSVYYCSERYDKGSVTLLKNSTPTLELHIPSSGPLTAESVYDSLTKAYAFYKSKNRLTDGMLVAQCSSWLLYPGLKEFLHEGSNISKFQDNFDITYVWLDHGFGDCWRMFNTEWHGDASELPRETRLQKEYAEWLSKGNVPGEGAGVLIFDGKSILTGKEN